MSVSCAKSTSVVVWNATLTFFHLRLPASFPLSVSFMLYGSENGVDDWLSNLWNMREGRGMTIPSEWLWFISFLLSFFAISLLCFLHIILWQKADVSVEEVSGCVQPRGTVWAHPPDPQSPWVHLQVHCSLADALLPVSVCVYPWCGLMIMISTFNFLLNLQ